MRAGSIRSFTRSLAMLHIASSAGLLFCSLAIMETP
jgi:hypothetical protein